MKLFVIGAGGHAKVIIDLAFKAGFGVAGILDDARAKGTLVCGVEVLGRCVELQQLATEKGAFAVVVAIGNNAFRAKVVGELIALVPEITFPELIHPSAVIGADVSIGAGSVIMAGGILNPGCQVGAHVIVNTKVSVDHDGTIGDFASLAPGVTLGGGVCVGGHSAIGLGANIIHGVSIGEHTVIGAGALVNHAIPDYVVAYGVPARIIRSRAAGDRYL